MTSNSRNSVRWGLATAATVLALGSVPLTFQVAAAGAEGNGRLIAAHATTLPEENQEQPAADIADDVSGPQASAASSADDGDLIRDDSDVASVDGSANDAAAADPAGELFGGLF
jgi:hypothetical protein